MSKLIDFVGSKLTHGSFHQMCLEISKQIAITTPAALRLEALAPQYADAVARMGKVILRQSGYAETLDVSRTDANRDALFYSIYYAVHYLRSLSADHALHPHVKQLLPLINTYKGISQHELNKESSEIAGFLANASLPDNAKAMQALGLTPLLAALSDENQKLQQSAATRTGAAATRAAATGDDSTDTVRRELVDLHHRIVARVNAVAELDGTPEVETFIAYANKVAEHYRMVMANQAKKSGGGEAPEPVTEEDAK